MSYNKVKEWRNNTKQMLVNCLGGKCNRCGYNRYVGAMDFHHLGGKKDSIAQMLRNLKKTRDIIAECKKCVLLCKVCHPELHAGIWSLKEIDIVSFDEDKLPWKWGNRAKICGLCGKDFQSNDKRAIYCSKECKDIKQRRIERPPKSVILKQIEELGYVGTAKLYGVSDNAIRKWIR